MAMNPTANDLVPQSAIKVGNTLEFTYTKNKAATDVSFALEWSDTLANDWSNAGVTEQILSDNSTAQMVKVSVAAGSSGQRFLHLKISKL